MARSGERGQVLPLLLIVLVLAAGAAAFVGEVGVAAIEQGRAQTAGDAAALAGAAEGPRAAASVATANGAEVVGYLQLGSVVEVEVRYRRGRALATAEAIRAGIPGAGGDRDGLAPAMLAALARADSLLGVSVPVTSGYRSRVEQEALWARRDQNPYPVAPPGSSMHEAGLAIDVPVAFVERLRSVGTAAGLCQPLPQGDPVHFETCPPNRPA